MEKKTEHRVIFSESGDCYTAEIREIVEITPKPKKRKLKLKYCGFLVHTPDGYKKVDIEDNIIDDLDIEVNVAD